MKDWYDCGVKVMSRRTAQANKGRICPVYIQDQRSECFTGSQFTYLWSNLDLNEFPLPSRRDAQCINGRFILSEENSKGTGNAFNTKQIVSANEFNRDLMTNLRI
jgi:hypothetical protein